MDILQTGFSLVYDYGNAKFYETYNKQISLLRQSLLGNKIDYAGSSTTDPATKTFYKKVQQYALALTALNIGFKAILNKKNDKTYKDLEAKSLSIQENNIKNNTKAESEIKTYYDTDVPARKKQLEEAKYKNWLGDDTITNEQIEEKNKKFSDSSYKPDEISKELKDSGFESNINTFPKPGEEIVGHNTENGVKFVNRASFEVYDKGKKEILFKGWSKFGKPDPDKYSTPSNPMSDKVARMLEEYRKTSPGSYKFFIEKLHGKSVDGTFYTKNPIQAGKTRIDYPNRMVFPAYIMAFNDSYQAQWSDYSFIGRGEKVWIYQNTSRELTIEFYMISDFSVDLLNLAIEESRYNSNPLIKASPDSKWKANANLNANTFSSMKDIVQNIKGVINPADTLAEIKRLLPDWGLGAYPVSSIINGNDSGFVPGMISGTPEMMWARLTFLAQCIYPWYRKDGKLKEQPFVRIRIGDFIDSIAKINSLTLNEYNEFDIDLNPSVVGAIPMGVRVVLSMSIVHEEEPNSNYSRFYWRKDFDINDQTYKPKSFQETSETLDGSLDYSKDSEKGSLNEGQASAEGGLSKMEITRQEALGTFNNSLKGMQTAISSSSVSSFAKSEAIKNSLLSAKRFLETKNQNEATKLKNISDEDTLAATSMISSAVQTKKEDQLPVDPLITNSKKRKLFG